MNKIYIAATFILATILMGGSCGKTPAPAPTAPADPCVTTGLTISAATTASSSCASTGSINVTASGGSGLQYQLDGGTFVATNNFTGVSAGAHSVAVKNTEGCTKSTTVMVTGSGGSGITINETTVASNPCFATGLGDGSIAIMATSSPAGALEYKLDAGAFGSSANFTAVSPGAHAISVRAANGCIETKMITVGTKPTGPLFTAVKNLMSIKCGGCHNGGGSSGGFNFDDDCNIVVKKDRINIRAVVQGTMPQSGPLSASEKAIITNWLNAGGQKGN